MCDSDLGDRHRRLVQQHPGALEPCLQAELAKAGAGIDGEEPAEVRRSKICELAGGGQAHALTRPGTYPSDDTLDARIHRRHRMSVLGRILAVDVEQNGGEQRGPLDGDKRMWIGRVPYQRTHLVGLDGRYSQPHDPAGQQILRDPDGLGRARCEQIEVTVGDSQRMVSLVLEAAGVARPQHHHHPGDQIDGLTGELRSAVPGQHQPQIEVVGARVPRPPRFALDESAVIAWPGNNRPQQCRCDTVP